MKIAVTHENGQVFQHFGHCAEFKIYEVENGEIKSSAVVGTDGAGHGALAGFLQLRDVEALICGGIGARRQKCFGGSRDRDLSGCKRVILTRRLRLFWQDFGF